MSEEEKKAIESLKWYFEDSKSLDIAKQTDIVLNLIEKQQKEIEELKKDNNHQWEERCRLTFELQETEDRLSKIELQLLEEE